MFTRILLVMVVFGLAISACGTPAVAANDLKMEIPPQEISWKLPDWLGHVVGVENTTVRAVEVKEAQGVAQELSCGETLIQSFSGETWTISMGLAKKSLFVVLKNQVEKVTQQGTTPVTVINTGWIFPEPAATTVYPGEVFNVTFRGQTLAMKIAQDCP